MYDPKDYSEYESSLPMYSQEASVGILLLWLINTKDIEVVYI